MSVEKSRFTPPSPLIVVALISIVGFTPTPARAACPAPYHEDDCTVVMDVCQYGSTSVICDTYREGGSYGAVAWAVYNEGGAVCDSDAEYCIFGTESTNTKFCCPWIATDELELALFGTPQQTDYLYFYYSSGAIDADLENWNTGSIPVFEGHGHGRGGDDYLYGSRVAATTYHDELYGNEGADHVYGQDGSDDLDGGVGADYLYGGDSNDTLRGGDGDDELYGEGHDDTLHGEGDYDLLEGGSGADHLYGGLLDDELLGQSGADTCYGGSGDDLIQGGTEADTLYGEDGIDELSGGSGADTLQGDDGADTLCGDDDDDTLSGSADNDVLWGGAGSADVGNGNGQTGAPGDTCDSGTTETRTGCESVFSFTRPCSIGP